MFLIPTYKLKYFKDIGLNKKHKRRGLAGHNADDTAKPLFKH